MNKTANYNRDSSAPDLFDEAATTPEPPAWKDEVNRRLAAHRNRQSAPQTVAPVKSSERRNSSRAAEAAARVAARYAKAPTYRDLFVGDAEAVVRAAGAAVEAARDAQAAAEAVLAGLQAHLPVAADSGPKNQTRWQDEPDANRPGQEASTGAAMPRWHDTIPTAETRDVWEEMRVQPSSHQEFLHNVSMRDAATADSLIEAIIEPVQTSAANLIEFPRELIAPRKARPRLAEGPFGQQTPSPQLSIFEVDPGLMAANAPVEETHPPQWTRMDWEQGGMYFTATDAASESLESRSAEVLAQDTLWESLPHIEPDEILACPSHLDEPDRTDWEMPQTDSVQAEAAAQQNANTIHSIELFVAGKADRLLAGIVDFCLVTLAYLGAATVVLASTDHPLSGLIALEASVAGILIFILAYLALFFAFSDHGTPGMRYARIALCTFDDNNPTLQQSILRVPAMLLAALPLGAGLLWAAVDRDGLGLHDRLSKTYQRKY